MTRAAIVYAIRHIATGNAYVGCTTRKTARWEEHKSLLHGKRHHSYRLQSLWDQFGENSFEWVVLETLVAPEKPSMVAAELRWISAIGTLNTHIATDDKSGFTLRPEDAENQRRLALATIAANPELKEFLTDRGKQIAALAKSPEGRAAMGETTKRRWKDPQQRKALEKGLENRWAQPDAREKAAEAIRNSTPEVRQKRGNSLKATWADPERNKVLMESRMKRWADPEAKARQSEKMRAAHAKRRAAKAGVSA